MTMVVAPTIFESINARTLTSAQVAERFVPSKQYDQLVQRRHAVIVGPRGSGKTTLLKMLQPAALEVWDNPAADQFRSRIDFTGVFIPTDVSWNIQVRSLGLENLSPLAKHRIEIAAFTTHVLRGLVMAMLDRTRGSEGAKLAFRRVSLPRDSESLIVRDIASAWELEPSLPTLLGLKQALGRRLLEVQSVASQEPFGDFDPESRVGATRGFHLNFLQAASYAVEVFDDTVGESNAKWGLLFDELELAPNWIREELLRAMRSANPKFLFKLAMSPFSNDFNLQPSPTAAAPEADYDAIPLWYARKRETYDFCEQLWYSMLAEKSLPPLAPRELLGRSYFETPRAAWEEHGTAYLPGTRIGKMFSRLAKSDRTFRSFLESKGVNPDRLDKVDPERRASNLRKIAPLIPVREFYRSPDNVRDLQRQQHRSRKSPTLYSGAEALFAISEGNPRWFIGIVQRLLARWDQKSNRISARIQAAELERASQRFSALLRTIPVEGITDLRNSRGLLTIADQIGTYFHEQVVNIAFTPEPALTFKVDSHADQGTLRALEQALNAGALVYLADDPSQLILTSLKGKRFRLSYLLAPKYGLPLRLGKSASLSRILGRRDAPPKPTRDLQLPLDGGQ